MGAAPDRAEELFTEHSRRIYAYCLRRLGSPEEAEDALQATYLNACRSLLSGFEPEVAQAWLFKVAQNVCLTKQRSSWRRRRVERAEDLQEIQDFVAAPQQSGDELFGIDEALATLPEQQRRAILLREWKGLSYREVATEMGLSQGAVETLIFRARRSLAAALEEPQAPQRRAGLMHGLQGGALLASLKSALGGSMSASLATGLAVAASATAIATSPIGRADNVRPTLERAAQVEHAKPAVSQPFSRPALADHDLVSISRGQIASPRGNAKGKDHGQGKPDFAGAKTRGQGSHGGGKPSWAGSHEPPAHAQAGGQGKSQGSAQSSSKRHS
jgi:RNA polymerase sigma-70 factor, ECF subfamily